MIKKSEVKVFLVDDDPFCLFLYEQYLKNLGFRKITLFDSGADCLQQLQQTRPDILVMDYHLSDIEGLELLQRAREAHAGLYSVLISGQKELAVVVDALNKGAFDYIIKGDDAERRLSEVMEKFMAIRRQDARFPVLEDRNLARLYLSAVFEAQEQERKRMATELHDNICQMLAVSMLYLDMAKNEGEQRHFYLSQTKKVVTETLQEIRQLSHGLSLRFLDETATSDSVVALLGQYRDLALFSFQTSLENHRIELIHCAETQLAVLRIIQEIFNNIVKHADAHKVFFSLTIKPEALYLEIRDDGRGFDPAKRVGGIGLRNILARIEYCGGAYRLVSAPGEGCTWSIIIPLATDTASVVSTPAQELCVPL